MGAGLLELVNRLNRAVGAGSVEAITARVKADLEDLLGRSALVLDGRFRQPRADHYARRLLYQDPSNRYTAVVMTWGPGQGTPVHDHGGLWCVEGVWDGELEIVQYELLERDGNGRFRFRAAGGIHAGPGSAGSLIPPHEYHTIRNASADAVAISLHIYKAEMACCAKFVPERPGAGDEWFVREAAVLKTDEAA